MISPVKSSRLLAVLAFTGVFNVGSGVEASTRPPPADGINLIYPVDEVLPVGSTINIGWNDRRPLVYGLVNNVSQSFVWPNGTESPLGVTFGPCRTFPGTSYAVRLTLTERGRYIFYWNITYGVSSDPTQNDSERPGSCGQGPFSYQSWILNHTLEATGDTTATTALQTTVSTSLPSSPTGIVLNAGIANYAPTYMLMFLVFTTVVAPLSM